MLPTELIEGDISLGFTQHQDKNSDEDISITNTSTLWDRHVAKYDYAEELVI